MKSVKFEEYLEERKSYYSLKENFIRAYNSTERGQRDIKIKNTVKEFIGFITIVAVGYIILNTDNFIMDEFKEVLKCIE